MTEELRFDGQVAVVTGAGRGLGREYARLLADRGARVVVNDVGTSVTGAGSDGGTAAAVAEEIRSAGGEAVADTHSVADAVGGQAVIDRALDTWGRIDIVVNNAGTVRDAPFDDMDDSLVSPLLDVHLRYGAAKTGMLGLTRVLAAEGAGAGIRVNAIAPIAATRMLEQSMASVVELADAEAAALAEQVMRPFLDKLDPALVAPVVAFLAHRDCPVSGEIYTAGAGQVARFFIGRTPGYSNPALSAEDVRDQFEKIRDTTGFTVPAGPADEMAELHSAIMADGA